MTTGLKVSLLMDEGTRGDLLKMIKEQVRPLVKENLDAVSKALIEDTSRKLVDSQGDQLRSKALEEFKKQLYRGPCDSELMREVKETIRQVVEVKFAVIVKNYTDNYLNATVGRMVREEVKRMLAGQ